jgi:predicted transcriptional regulator
MSQRRRYVCGHRLPALEADVLELLLRSQRPMSVTEVQHALPGARRAHTTISTLLSRLADRGLVQRRSRDRVYEWFPAGSPEELAITALERVLEGVEHPDAVVLEFLNRRGRPPARRRKER